MKFKDDIVAARYEDMAKLCKVIAEDADEFARVNYGIEILLTATVSTIEEDKILNRESDTHRTRRAFDVRTKDLPESLIAEMCAFLRKKHNRHGAMVKGTPELIVYKPHGTGPHLHIQINRKYALKPIEYKGNNDGKES